MRAQAHKGRLMTRMQRPSKRDRTRRLIAGIVLFVVVIGRPTLYAQDPVQATPAAPAAPAQSVAAGDATPVEGGADPVRLLVGRSTIVNVGRPIARVSLTSADIADAHVTAPSELLLNGKTPGSISMFVWDRAGAIRRYDVFVQRDLTRLTQQLKELFPGEPIEVRANGRSAVLSGAVTNKDIIEKAGSLAASFVEKKEDLVNLLQIRNGAPSNQVLLRVRFAEVSRSAMTELGASFAANGYKDGRWFGRTTTQQFPAPGWDQDGKFIFSDFLNFFLFDTKNQLAVVIKALQSKGLFQSLAEPNVVAESGKEASFLAGGEFPVPVAQASTTGTSVTVEYKEFGIRLNFTPVVNGDRVHLKVRPEVSTLDFNNAVVLNGFRIPALSTRRTETELELQNNQTFAIAGLINNTMLSSVQKIPGIGHIPILGLLFTSKAAQKQQTELVVMITPEILPNNSNGVTPDLPRQQEPYMPPLQQNKSVPPPPPAFQSSMARPAAPTANTAIPSATEAAAALKAIAPDTRTLAGDTTAGAADATPAAMPTAASASPTTTATPQALTDEERQALEREQKAERSRAAAQVRIDAAETKRLEKEAEQDRRRQAEEQARLDKAEKVQAQRDAEAAKKAAEEAKRQAEIDKQREREAAAASKRLREAQAAYEAELARIQGKK